MAFTALTDLGFPPDLAAKILMEKAALTIQSFFRRSLFRVQYYTNTSYSADHWPGTRYKPLGIVLRGMLKTIVRCQKWHCERKRCYKKTSKKLFFKVTLMRHTKLFGDIPIITVTNKTVFRV